MLIVAGTITFDPAHRETAETAAVAMMEATLEEPGCQQYVFSVQMGSPATIRVFEVWDDADDLQAHFAMPHMTEFQNAIAGIGISGRDLVKYQISSSEPL
jgi:quinol monooxygenase YgiN